MGEGRDKIKKLDTRQQCRDKLPIFFGSRDNFYHGFREVIANSSDEITNNYESGGWIKVNLFDDCKTISIRDSGRGIPFYKKTDGEWNYELLFMTLFAGTNYDNLQNGKIAVGTNGCGTCVLNHTSELFEVTTFTNDTAYTIKFADGGYLINKECPIIVENGNFEHGTLIKFKLDKSMYADTIYNPKEIKDILYNTAGINNKLNISFSYGEEAEEYCFENTEQFFNENNTVGKLSNTYTFSNKEYRNKIVVPETGEEFDEVDVVGLSFCLSTEPTHKTFLNYNHLTEHGTIYDGIVDGMRKFFNKHEKTKLTAQDIEMSFSFISYMESNNAEFTSQTKFATKKDLYKKIASEYVLENMEVFKLENEKVFNAMLSHLKTVNKFNDTNDKKRKELSKKLTESGKGLLSVKVEGLRDCDMKNSVLEERILILDEGLSANSTIIDAFDNRYMGCYGLKGRFINSLKSSVTDVLNNIPAYGIIRALGCGIEIPYEERKHFKDIETYNENNLRYGTIAILCDADAFGKGISLSLITFFMKYFPTLCNEGRIYLVASPRYEIRNKRLESYYAYNDEEKNKIVNELGRDFYDVSIRKGLGEFDKEEFWEYVLSPEARKRTFTQVSFDGDKEEIVRYFNMLMGEDIDSRKSFIRENIVNVNLDELE